jgi:hypothetical protein
MSEADDDAKTRIRALKSSLDEENLSRKVICSGVCMPSLILTNLNIYYVSMHLFKLPIKMIENDRDVLREMLEKNTKEKLDAEKAAKRACDDLRILNTKHERLLQAQRAATSNPYTTPSFDAVVNPVPKRSANGPSEVFNYSPATPEDCRKVYRLYLSNKNFSLANSLIPRSILEPSPKNKTPPRIQGTIYARSAVRLHMASWPCARTVARRFTRCAYHHTNARLVTIKTFHLLSSKSRNHHCSSFMAGVKFLCDGCAP